MEPENCISAMIPGGAGAGGPGTTFANHQPSVSRMVRLLVGNDGEFTATASMATFLSSHALPVQNRQVGLAHVEVQPNECYKS